MGEIMRLGVVAAMAVFLSFGFVSVSQAGGTVRSDWSCTDVLSEVYNREFVEVAGQTLSLRSCERGERVTLATRDNARCVELNRCVANQPAPQPPQHGNPPPSGGNSGGYYSDPNGAWNCASPQGCGCNRGGCEFRDYNNNNYNNGNGGA
jgi:hypothetical protein